MALAVAGLTVGVTAADAAKKGGTMRINSQSDFDYTDPALDYLSSGWNLEYATCVKLLNYPDKAGAAGSQIRPEAASALPKVSKGGKVYTFNVPPNRYKFSPPSKQGVTAKTFKFVIERIANPEMQSPFQPFIADIVGAQAVLDGKAKTISGIKVKGSTLTITLTQGAPDFLARIAMPSFCALPTNTPVDPNGVDAPSGAGPYYIAERTPKRSVVLKRNPNYKGPRTANLSEIRYTIGVDPAATLLAIKSGQSDYALDGVPPSEYAGLWNQYGPSSKLGKAGKQQFFVNPQLGTRYIAMNTERGVFRGNAKLRQAVNFAIDRPNILRQGGAYAGKVTDQILPPGINGFKEINAYPLRAPDVSKAKALAGSGSRTAVYYASTNPIDGLRAQVVQANLRQIGIDVQVKQFARATQILKEGTRGEPFDMTYEGWIADYADPFDFVNVLLDGDNLKDSNNNNVAYFNNPTYNKAMDQAAKLFGAARYNAYAKLDQDITTKAAPWATTHNFAARDIYSSRIGGQVYQPTYGMNLSQLFVR